MDFEQAPDDFGYIVFDHTDREADARRFYMIAWQATLIDDGAVVRTFGRKGRMIIIVRKAPLSDFGGAAPRCG